MVLRRYLINLKKEPAYVEDIEKAVTLGFKIAGEYGISKIVILIPTLQNLENDRSIVTVLGENLAKKLKKERIISYKGFKLQLETIRTFVSADALKSIVIAVYATEEMFDKLNEIKRAEAIIAVPWIMSETQKWIATWDPELIE